MAQFKSSAREGSFQNNQLIVPDEVKKIQNEGNRRLQGMSTAQAHLQKNQEIFLRAQQQTQMFQQDDRRRALDINQSNLKAKQKAHADNWARALAQEEAKNKSKVDTFGALAAFSKTAFDITSSVVQQNRENQLKAINQIAFKHQYTFQDLVNAKSVNSTITQSAWQETNIVQDYLKQGKSQEFINTMYDHLVKGGGYKNYIDNSNVLSETARSNSRVFDNIANDPSLSVGQKRQKAAKAEALMRGELSFDGKTPGVEILEKAYNPIIRSALNRFDSIVNKETRAKLQEDNSNYRTSIINDAAFSGGDFNAQAVVNLVASDPRPGAINEMVEHLTTRGLPVDDLNALAEATFNRNGQMVSIKDGGYTDAYAKIKSAISQQTIKDREQQVLEVQARQLEATMAMNSLAQELATDDGILSDADYRRVLKRGDEVFGGPGRDTSNDNFYKRQTADANLKPVMIEALEEMRLDQSLSVAELQRINPPKDVYNLFIQDAERFDKVRNSVEYKELDKYLYSRISGAIKDLQRLNFNPAGPQSDQVNWFIGEQVKKYRQQYFDLAFPGADPNLKDQIGNRAATESLAALEADGALTYQGITAYNDAMAKSRTETLATIDANRKRTLWKNLKKEEKQDASNWVPILGSNTLKMASAEFDSTGKSQLLDTIASDTKLTIYEVQQKLGEAGVIEPVELNPTYAEIQSNWSKEQRYSFTSNQASNQQKLRTLQQQVNQLQSRNDYPVRSTFQQSQATVTGAGVAPEDDTKALLEISDQLGINALDLATIIGFETGGTYSPDTWGGDGGNYLGLIQFGGPERQKYGVVEGMSFRNQLISVAAFLKDRFEGVGMSTQGASLLDLYTTVLAGNPKASRYISDSNGTSPTSGVAAMDQHREAAAKRYGFSLP